MSVQRSGRRARGVSGASLGSIHIRPVLHWEQPVDGIQETGTELWQYEPYTITRYTEDVLTFSTRNCLSYCLIAVTEMPQPRQLRERRVY